MIAVLGGLEPMPALLAREGKLDVWQAMPSHLRLRRLFADIALDNIHSSNALGDAVGAEWF